MGGERTIALCGISDDERVVFSSLLNIISFKTSERWTLVSGAYSDVIVVNVDSHRGQAYLRKATSDALVIQIAENNHAPSQDNVCLRRPLRARDILTCLEIISQQALLDNEWKLAGGKE